MAISINWTTKVISVPKADLTLIQSDPTEIRELDVDWFRYQLKALEAGEEGQVFPDTHRHSTEVEIAGMTLARVVEIINGYTVTFEDGQYAVNIVGANSNIADVTNVNQVSIRPFNSAGLITSKDIQYDAFRDGVWIDTVHGIAGAVFPVGTARRPVNNLADAKIIAEYRGFTKIYILGSFTFGATDNIDGYTIQGQNEQHTTVVLIAGCSTEDVRFNDIHVSGALGGDNCCFHKCELGSIDNLAGTIWTCILSGNYKLAGSYGDNVLFLGCFLGTALAGGLIEIDMNGDGPALSMRAFTGGLKVKNKSGAAKVAIDFVSGRMEITNTVTAGTFYIRGVGEITSNEGTGITIHRDPLTQTIKDTVDSIDVNVIDVLSDAEFIKQIEGGKWSIVNNEMIFYKDDNITEIMRFTITRDAEGNPIMRTRQ